MSDKDRLFDLLEKIYIELQETKSELSDITDRLKNIEKEVSFPEEIILRRVR